MNIKAFTILWGLCLPAVYTAAWAQDTSNCYRQWEKTFEQRGSKDIEEGEHNNVIITVRKKVKESEDDYHYITVTNCYSGKAIVKDNKVVDIYMKVVDNTFEKMDKKFKYFNLRATIDNGITRNIITEDGDIINVIFHEKLKGRQPKKSVAEISADDMK